MNSLRFHSRDIQRVSRSRESFTLVEILAVMLLVVLLTGITIGSVGYVNRKAAESKTRALLAKISLGLETYKADWGDYPLYEKTGAGWQRTNSYEAFNTNLLIRLAGLKGGKRYVEFANDETNLAVFGGAVGLYIVDGFGQPIYYYPSLETTNTQPRGTMPNGRVNFTSYDLWSAGGDLKSTNTYTYADDIKNWE